MRIQGYRRGYRVGVAESSATLAVHLLDLAEALIVVILCAVVVPLAANISATGILQGLDALEECNLVPERRIHGGLKSR